MDSRADDDRKRSEIASGRNRWWRRWWLSRRWLFLPPIAVGLLVIFLMVRSRREVPRLEIPESITAVEVMTAASEVTPIRTIGFGTAVAARRWTAIAEVGGRIEATHPSLESGNWVDAGDMLVRIDAADYKLRLDQRKAEHDAARASLAELKASQVADNKSLQIEKDLLRVTRKDFARMQRFRESNSVSLSELELAESNLLKQTQAVQHLENALTLYPARIANAEARVAMAAAAVREAERDVDRTVIRSPMRGVLARVDLEPGQVVAPGQQLFQLQDNRRLEIEARISLAQLQQLMPSGEFSELSPLMAKDWLEQLQAEVIYTSGNESHRWAGRPIRLTEAVDTQTRTIGVVVAVENSMLGSGTVSASGRTAADGLQERTTAAGTLPIVLQTDPSDPAAGDHSATVGPSPDLVAPPQPLRMPLTPGTYCEVHLIAQPNEPVITVPRTAFEGQYVYVVDDQHRLQKRLVQRGAAVGDRVIVRSGIRAGEMVVVRPPLPAIEGMLVSPQ